MRQVRFEVFALGVDRVEAEQRGTRPDDPVP
jgi:hypothetical protein